MATLAPPRAASSLEWEALGTRVVLRLQDGTAPESARAAVVEELEAIDRACSRFRPDSELSHLNARAGRAISAGPLLLEAVAVAVRAAQLSGGDVDPTLGRALELAGYDRDFSLLAPAQGEPAPATITLRATSGWRLIELDADAGTIRVPSTVRLDLGATAKAWAADRAAAAAAAASGCGALVAVGGDIATAGQAPAGGWPIHVTDDHRSGPSAPGQTVLIQSGGLATSSTMARRWSHDGHTMHHIIDPATGVPARGPWRTASVAAADCTEANIAATAALLRGEGAAAWLTDMRLPARLVTGDGAVRTVAGWPAQRDGEDTARPGAGAAAAQPRAGAGRVR